MSDLSKRLEEIEARVGKATPGPWEWARDGLDGRMFSMKPSEGWARDAYDADEDGRATRTTIIETDSGAYPPRDNDRDFIAHARADVPALLAALRVAIGQRDEWIYDGRLSIAQIDPTIARANAAILAALEGRG